LIFQNAHEFGVYANSQNQTFFFIRTYEGGPDNFHEFAKLVSFDEFTGKTIWQFNDDFSHGDFGYLINDKFVFMGTEDGFIYSVDSKTGDVSWQTKTGDFPFAFVLEGNNLIAVYKKSYVSVLDTRTGSQKWKLDLGLAKSWSIFGDKILNINGNTLFVAGNNHRKIYAVDMDTGKQLWSWDHFRPADSEYQVQLVFDNVIYVDEQQSNGSIFDALLPDYLDFNKWIFALKTEP
jgi:outer membrane protein assembly factor BamB